MTPAHFYIILDNSGAAIWGDLDDVSKQITADTLCVREIENGHCWDATEKACLRWCKLNDREIELDDDGRADVPALVRNNCEDYLTEIEGKAAEAKAGERYERKQYQMAAF